MEEGFEAVAAERLEVFNTRHLHELTLPKVWYAHSDREETGAFYAVAGNPVEARALIFSEVPHSTHLEDESIKVRLLAQQEVVGPDYCVIGVETYSPDVLKLSAVQRKAVRSGDFRPLSERFAAVVNTVKPRDDQGVYVYGFSRGADVGVQFTHDSLFNPNFAGSKVHKLGAFEIARTCRQIGLLTMINFGRSGGMLYQNVIESGSAALLEARGIDLANPRAEKQHNKEVQSGVVAYFMADIVGNLALTAGFSRPDSVTQLVDISFDKRSPLTIVGRMHDSRVFSDQDFEYLSKNVNHDWFVMREYVGDHAAADKLSRSAAFMLETVTS